MNELLKTVLFPKDWIARALGLPINVIENVLREEPLPITPKHREAILDLITPVKELSLFDELFIEKLYIHCRRNDWYDEVKIAEAAKMEPEVVQLILTRNIGIMDPDIFTLCEAVGIKLTEGRCLSGDDPELPGKLKMIRESRGLTVAAVAKAIGRPRKSVEEYESKGASIGWVPMSLVRLMCALYRVKVDFSIADCIAA